jgi:hypothetical protein
MSSGSQPIFHPSHQIPRTSFHSTQHTPEKPEFLKEMPHSPSDARHQSHIEPPWLHQIAQGKRILRPTLRQLQSPLLGQQFQFFCRYQFVTVDLPSNGHELSPLEFEGHRPGLIAAWGTAPRNIRPSGEAL